MKKKLALFSLLLLCFKGFSQKLINSCGTHIISSSGGSYQFSYSIGEIAITTLYGNSTYATQGVIQPNASPELKTDNTAEQTVTLQLTPIGVSLPESLLGGKYLILASDGKLIEKGVIQKNSLKIDHLASGVYFLKIIHSSQDSNPVTTKIIKL